MFKLSKLISIGIIGAACLLSIDGKTEECEVFCDPCGCEDGFYLGADYLYWTTCQNNVGYVSIESITETELGDFDKLKVKNFDYDWKSGFRIFGGYQMGNCCWDIRGIYTYFNTDAHGSFNEPLFISTFTPQIDATLSAKLKYRVADVLIGRDYEMACCSRLRPFVGFRALWLDQDHHGTITLKNPDMDDLSEANSITKDSADLFAAGINAGLDWQWNICDGFGIYAGGAASILQGNVKYKIEEITNELPPFSTSFKNDHCFGIPGYNLIAGVSWESCFESCGFRSWVRFVIAYEFTHWFNIPASDLSATAVIASEFEESFTPPLSPISAPPLPITDQLTLQGLTFRASYMF